MFEKKSFFTGLVVGICLVVTVLSVWVTWSIRVQTVKNTQAVAQITTFLNSAITQAQVTPAPAVDQQ